MVWISAVIIAAVIMIYIVAEHNHLILLHQQLDHAHTGMEDCAKARNAIVNELNEDTQMLQHIETMELQSMLNARSDTESERMQKEEQASELLQQQAEENSSRHDQKYQNLIAGLKKSEAALSESRDAYNEQVRAYNQECTSFPGSVIAKLFGFETASPISSRKS